MALLSLWGSLHFILPIHLNGENHFCCCLGNLPTKEVGLSEKSISAVLCGVPNPKFEKHVDAACCVQSLTQRNSAVLCNGWHSLSHSCGQRPQRGTSDCGLTFLSATSTPYFFFWSWPQSFTGLWRKWRESPPMGMNQSFEIRSAFCRNRLETT